MTLRACLLLMACLACPDVAGADDRRELVVGRVSSKPHEHFAQTRPLADYVAVQLADLGFRGAKVVLARNNDEMADWLRRGLVDWVSESPLSAVDLSSRTGALPLLRRWKDGVAEYSSVVFVRRDSGIDSLDGLLGQRVAFEDADSTTAFRLPMLALQQHGLPSVRLASLSEPAPDDAVGYLFAGAELNITYWVFRGEVAAGALSDLDWADPGNVPVTARQALRVVYRSPPLPRAVDLVRGDLDARVRERLVAALVRAHEDAAGRLALARFQDTKRYDRLSPEQLATLRTTWRALQGVGGG